ncbi:MAG: hypothetical protein DI588_09170 [Flavobacterium johnsoniae]|nr:MAG: hypothetical protein DI588_09170 [Flavobacterium johnsoniae]
MLPHFKASLNGGLVMRAEIETEIAYHDKVLHIAVRVQKLCDIDEADLLITDSFRESKHEAFF